MLLWPYLNSVLGMLFVIAFLQVDATRRFPASFVEYSNLLGD